MTTRAAPLLASVLSILLAGPSASAQTAVELFERGSARLTLDGLVRDWSGFGKLRAADDRASVTAGLASDTLIGPLFAGLSVGQGGEARVYFLIGRSVR